MPRAALTDKLCERVRPPESGRAEYRRILDQEVVARWRYRRIGQVTRRDIIALVDEVAGRGATGYADKVRAWVHALMNRCLSRDLIEANPAAALRRPHKTKIRSRVLGDEELRGIWKAAEGLGFPFGPVVQLLVLTGQRRGEVCRMRWPDVNLKDRLWVMGDTKGGRPHREALGHGGGRAVSATVEYLRRALEDSRVVELRHDRDGRWESGLYDDLG